MTKGMLGLARLGVFSARKITHTDIAFTVGSVAVGAGASIALTAQSNKLEKEEYNACRAQYPDRRIMRKITHVPPFGYSVGFFPGDEKRPEDASRDASLMHP